MYALNGSTSCIFHVPEFVCSRHSVYTSEQSKHPIFVEIKLMLRSQQTNKVMTIMEEEEVGKGIGAFLDGCNYI